jgi:membrane protein DedA with SNARE-associated domain
MNEFIDWLNNSVHSFDPFWRDVIAGFAIFLETSLFIGLLIPGDTVVLAAGAMVRDWLDFLFLFLSVMAGSFAGESLGFYIGRVFGNRIRSSKLGLKIPEKVWHQADAFVESRGGLAIAMSRFLPVLHSIVPVTAGMTKMTYRTFISWTVGACAVWSSIYLGIGWFAHGATDALKQFKFGGAIFAGIILAFLIIITVAKKRLEKSAEAMIEGSEEAKARAKKLREAEMKRPNL